MMYQGACVVCAWTGPLRIHEWVAETDAQHHQKESGHVIVEVVKVKHGNNGTLETWLALPHPPDGWSSK